MGFTAARSFSFWIDRQMVSTLWNVVKSRVTTWRAVPTRPSARLLTRLPARSAAAFAGLAVALLMTACSPKYDWRAVNDDTGRYAATFPGKPSLDERSITVDGRDLPMRMQTASVDEVVFAVGTVVLPEGAASLHSSVQTFVEQGIARNIGSPIAPTDVEITAADGRKLAGREWRAEGLIPGTKQGRSVIARFVSTDTRVYEAVIVSEHPPKKELIDQFFDGFKPF